MSNQCMCVICTAVAANWTVYTVLEIIISTLPTVSTDRTAVSTLLLVLTFKGTVAPVVKCKVPQVGYGKYRK